MDAFNSVSEQAEEFGLIAGPSGPHSSRTMMLAELQTLLDTVPAESDFGQFQQAVVDENVLGKSTDSNRKGTLRRLRELYSLDKLAPLFRVFRSLWGLDESGQPLLAILIA